MLSRGDEASLIELGERYKQRGERFVAFVQYLSAQWSALSERDKVKSVAKFFTEWECFGAVGRAIGGSLKAERLAQVGEVVAGEFTISEALAEEVVNITTHTLDKDPALVQKVIEFVQQDAEIFNGISRKPF